IKHLRSRIACSRRSSLETFSMAASIRSHDGGPSFLRLSITSTGKQICLSPGFLFSTHSAQTWADVFLNSTELVSIRDASNCLATAALASDHLTTVNPDPANGATDDPYDNEGYSSRGDNSTCEGSSNIRDSNTLHNRIGYTRAHHQR